MLCTPNDRYRQMTDWRFWVSRAEEAIAIGLVLFLLFAIFAVILFGGGV